MAASVAASCRGAGVVWSAASGSGRRTLLPGTRCCTTASADLALLQVPHLRFLLRLAGLPATGDRGILEERVLGHASHRLADKSEQLSRHFETELEAALGGVAALRRPSLLANVLPQMRGEDQLRKIVQSAAFDHASAVNTVAEARAFLALAAKAKQTAVQLNAASPLPGAPQPPSAAAPAPPMQRVQPAPANGTAPARTTPAGVAVAGASTGAAVEDVCEEDEEVVQERRASILNLEQTLRQWGVGGISPEAQRLLQRALLSRTLTESMRRQFGMRHQAGMLLYGPPGCGKTLIARCLGKALHATSVQYVTAADINAKYFGESDQRMQALFEPARASRAAGRHTDLHLIIMDEIDALTAARSDKDARNHESALNVLLTCMDGFEENEQTLVVGLTNRKDKIDPALLRPGRLGVHIEIGQPGEAGRLEVLEIHAAALVANGLLAPSVCLRSLARQTEGFSGAELCQLVNDAMAHALLRAGAALHQAGAVVAGVVEGWAVEAALEDVRRTRGLVRG